jgi:hypothetical protein
MKIKLSRKRKDTIFIMKNRAPFNYLRKIVNNLFLFPELVEGNITETVDFGGVSLDLFPFPELVEGNIT